MKIIVSGEYSNDLKIYFSQGTWKVIMYSLFENQQAIDVEFPRDPTLFKLSIEYDSENFYFENLFYISNPNMDSLSFHFYKENSRIFCKAKSDLVLELNKEIVLNPLPKSLKEVRDLMNDLDDNCASL